MSEIKIKLITFVIIIFIPQDLVIVSLLLLRSVIFIVGVFRIW